MARSTLPPLAVLGAGHVAPVIARVAVAAGRLLEPGGPVFGVSLRRPEFERALRAEAA